MGVIYMENILTKALDEVLTPRYSDELRDSYDTGYAVTAGFEEKMRELIRKTDRPPIKWGRYAAAAAAAVVAIGSAVLVPILMNSRVEVSPPESSVSETTSAVISEEEISTEITDDDAAVTSETSAVTPVTSDTDISSDETESENHLISETSAIDTAETETEPITDITEDSETTFIDEGEAIVEAEEEYEEIAPAANPVETSDEEREDDIFIVDSEEDSDADISVPQESSKTQTDVPVPKVTPEDEPEDEELEVEEEVEPDMPERIIDSDIPAGTKLSQIFSDKFGVSFDNLWANYGNYSPEGESGSGLLDTSERDIPFLDEFVHKLGNAEQVNAELQDNNTAEYIQINISDVKNGTIQRSFINTSPWLNYDQYFGQISDYDSDVEFVEEAEEEDPDMFKNITITVKVYRKTGIVSFIGNVNRYESGKYVPYALKKQYRMPAEDIDILFTEAEKMFFPKTATTAGAIASAMGITSEGISKAYANINAVYDTNIGNALIGNDYIAGLFAKYADKKLKQTTHYVSKGVTFVLYLKNYARLTVIVDRDGNLYLFDGIRMLYFKADENELNNAVKAVSAANGLDIPIYSTLGEYLNDKNFNKILDVSISATNENGLHGKWKLGTQSENNDGTLGRLADMIRSEFNSAKYINESKHSDLNDIHITVEGYSKQLILTKDNRLVIQTAAIQNVFKLSDGFYEKFKEAVLSSKNAVFVAADIEKDIEEDGDYTEEIIDEIEF